MYYYLSGVLAYKDLNGCVIDCGGVGYKLTISTITSEKIASSVGAAVKLFTHLAVREDGIELFGFIDDDERSCFNKLITVSGVGPKAAINILSTLSPAELVSAIASENTKAIAKAQGIGAKTAARIILELKDKIGLDFSMPDAATLTAGSVSLASGVGKNLSDATEALLSLGYDKSSIMRAVGGIDTAKLDVGEIVRLALKKLMR